MTMLSSETVCQRAHMTYRQLDYWCRLGVLKPTMPARGSGTHRRFSEEDLWVATVISALRAAGLTLEDIRPHLEHLDPHAGDVICAGRGGVFQAHGDVSLEEVAEAIMGTGRWITIVDVGRAMAPPERIHYAELPRAVPA